MKVRGNKCRLDNKRRNEVSLRENIHYDKDSSMHGNDSLKKGKLRSNITVTAI